MQHLAIGATERFLGADIILLDLYTAGAARRWFGLVGESLPLVDKEWCDCMQHNEAWYVKYVQKLKYNHQQFSHSGIMPQLIFRGDPCFWYDPRVIHALIGSTASATLLS